MIRQQQSILAPGHRSPEKVNAWILGSSIASLASAVHLIRDAKVPAPQIHILESRDIPGDGIISAGDSVTGYNYRAGCMPTFNDTYMERLLNLVPSTTNSNITLLEEIKKSDVEKPFQDSPGTHVLIRGHNGLEKMDVTKFGLGLKNRMHLMLLIFKSEQTLGRKRIDDLNTKKILDCTRYNQYESIIVPIVRFLQNQGADFRFRIKVTDIVRHSENGMESVSAITTVQDNSEEIIHVSASDIVIVSIGSVTSGSTSGSNTVPPLPPSMEAANELDENWSLWLNLGTKNPKFGDPYNFCTHVSESRLGTFTVTLNDTAGFFKRFYELTNGRPGSGNLITLKQSNWMISLCIPHQPFFSDQPKNIEVFWGYGLYPSQKGNFVKMPMTLCSGEELMTELLWHLDFPMEPILSNSITIPCVMPRMAAALLPRTSTDRPDVTPENITNFAMVGQFVEIADETTVSLDYSVRGAQLAVSRLMGIEGPPMRRKALHTPFLYPWR
ncbi:67 kDa myosin-cross-reactive antigen family protein [Talaromyces marneffei ATCC 18224]|uniref:67 kDa myosin-cross-reactive antigen family protein n=1 Tax=Talaromyces marneffei (strain ATCC 18224 / CBS 334.59 / QM 7333) TaxID=441960 RepID=B6QSB0_TALMQ|nr:67 kDa myosin-cross-reactive antigen family protein [Talaromyces marneffei ATCC 18224]